MPLGAIEDFFKNSATAGGQAVPEEAIRGLVVGKVSKL